MNKDNLVTVMAVIMFLMACVAVFIISLNLSGCTISMQNISTHGTATDLVDEEQTASPDFKTDLKIPVIP